MIVGGWLRVPWMTALFFGVGLGITILVRWAEGWHPIWDGQVITSVELAIIAISRRIACERPGRRNDGSTSRSQGQSDAVTIRLTIRDRR